MHAHTVICQPGVLPLKQVHATAAKRWLHSTYLWLHAGLLQDSLQDRGQQVICVRVLETAALGLADGGAQGAHDDHVVQ